MAKYQPSPAVIAARRASMAAAAAMPKRGRGTKAQRDALSKALELAYQLELAENPALRAEIAARNAR